MSTFLFYEEDAGAPTHRDDIEQALSNLGIAFSAPAGARYRPGTWDDAATGARAIIDVGEPAMERDEMHPPTAYAGWRPVAVHIQIPLLAAHWQAVEGLRLLERFLAALPHLVPLDCEDTRRNDGADTGPFPFDRLRALASWERQHAAHLQGRTDIAVLDRRASLALWRYRRERAAGQVARPDLYWPEALVLADGSQAVSVAVWADPSRALALPPVGYVVIPRVEGSGLLPSDEVLTAAGEPAWLTQGLARDLPVSPGLSALHQGARLVPAARFATVRDGDWVD